MSTAPLPDEISMLHPLVTEVERLVARTGRAVQVRYAFGDGWAQGPTFVGMKNPTRDPDDELALAVEELEDAASAVLFGAAPPTGLIMEISSPTDIVQPLYATKQWIVFATDGGGNDYALDLVPGPRGRIGQVVQFDHEREQPPEIVARSLTDFLAGRWVQNPRTTTPPPDPPPAGQSLRVGGDGTSIDLSPHVGSTTLRVLELDAHAASPVTDWLHLAVLPAVDHLEAPANHWQSIVRAEAYPPSLATATITDSRDLTVAEHVTVANSLLAHHGRDRFTLHRWTAAG